VFPLFSPFLLAFEKGRILKVEERMLFVILCASNLTAEGRAMLVTVKE
jgi:hypothetical protein